MKSHSSKAPTREAVLEAVRRAVKVAGGGRITLPAFLASSGMSQTGLFKHFARWKDAVRAAGFDFKFAKAPVHPDVLLADWGSVVRKLQRVPTRKDYDIEGKYGSATIQRRLGGWVNAPEAFLAFAQKKPEWADLEELIPTLPRPPRHLPKKPPGRPKSRWLTRQAMSRLKKNNLPICGVPIDSGVFRYAPMNENGVLLLFGSMAERLGFRFETVRTTFPDCSAVREAGPEMWEIVRIEFEYQSRNFRQHGHDPSGCDLIVCWEHNWPECPVEVLALKDEIKRLQTGN